MIDIFEDIKGGLRHFLEVVTDYQYRFHFELEYLDTIKTLWIYDTNGEEYKVSQTDSLVTTMNKWIRSRFCQNLYTDEDRGAMDEVVREKIQTVVRNIISAKSEEKETVSGKSWTPTKGNLHMHGDFSVTATSTGRILCRRPNQGAKAKGSG